MENKIKCLVEECTYNNQKKCMASSIEVASDDANTTVVSAANTACKTFTLGQF